MKKLKTSDMEPFDGYDMPRVTSKTAGFAEYGEYCYFEDARNIIENLKKQLDEKNLRIEELEGDVEKTEQRYMKPLFKLGDKVKTNFGDRVTSHTITGVSTGKSSQSGITYLVDPPLPSTISGWTDQSWFWSDIIRADIDSPCDVISFERNPKTQACYTPCPHGQASAINASMQFDKLEQRIDELYAKNEETIQMYGQRLDDAHAEAVSNFSKATLEVLGANNKQLEPLENRIEKIEQINADNSIDTLETLYDSNEYRIRSGHFSMTDNVIDMSSFWTQVLTEMMDQIRADVNSPCEIISFECNSKTQVCYTPCPQGQKHNDIPVKVGNHWCVDCHWFVSMNSIENTVKCNYKYTVSEQAELERKYKKQNAKLRQQSTEPELTDEVKLVEEGQMNTTRGDK